MIAFSWISSTTFTPTRPVGYSSFTGHISPSYRKPLSHLGKPMRTRCAPPTTMAMIPPHIDVHSLAQTSHDAHLAVNHLLSLTTSSSDHVLHSLSMLLSDATAAVADATATATAGANQAADAATGAADAAAKQGLWGSFVKSIESAIVSIHGLLQSAGIPGAYGLSIILFTVIIKAITFPLNYRQMESTMKMQAIAPQLRKIQADYRDNPTVMQQMTADLYKKQKVNPLAGCAPVFAQIPIWVALYRSVLNLAGENKLNESFLWLPSLQGPVSSTGKGLDTWLFPLIDGAPPIGWHDAVCYLTIPVILMATQFLTTKIMAPPQTDDSQAAANNLLKFMPLLIGWFSLNVPSGLGVYWVTNNVLSTAQTLFIRSRVPASSLAVDGDITVDATDVADGFSASDGGSMATSTKSSKSSKKKRRKRR